MIAGLRAWGTRIVSRIRSGISINISIGLTGGGIVGTLRANVGMREGILTFGDLGIHFLMRRLRHRRLTQLLLDAALPLR